MLDFVQTILIGGALLASIALLGLAVADFTSSTFRFWPPPKADPLKKTIFMTLFRVMVYGAILGSCLELWSGGVTTHRGQSTLAVGMLLAGFAIAFAATGALGWGQAFGQAEVLRTDGIFGYSRNPIYLATWLGLAGWALLLPSALLIGVLVCWGALYVVAIFLEERWLAQVYGDEFTAYCKRVRRIL